MATIGKVRGKPRLRYRINYPDGGWADRSRRYRTVELARSHWALSQQVEDKTKYESYLEEDIEAWRKARLVNDDDIERLGLNPGLKTLESAGKDWKRSWDVTSGEVVAREWRLRNILNILGRTTPVKFLRFSHGLVLKEELRKQGLKTTTIQRHIHDLKRMMRIQIANNVIQANPFSELSAGRIPVSEKIQPKALTPKEINTILDKARQAEPGWLYLLLLLAFGCGLRRKEVLSLEWNMIDWDSRVLILPEYITKTRKERRLGLGQKLFYELLTRKSEGRIFPEINPSTLSHIVSDLFKECGIKARLHDARHTYTTMIQTAGAQIHEAMQRTGHSDPSMLGHYSHATVNEIFEDKFEFLKVSESLEGDA